MIVASPGGDKDILGVALQPSNSYGTALASDTFTHQNVTPEQALAISHVYAVIGLIAKVAGTLPLQIFEQITDTRTTRRMGTPLAVMLGESPNPDMTAPNMWSTVLTHLLLRGNAYLAKVKHNGRVVAVYPIPPACVNVFRDATGRKIFRVTTGTGEPKDFTADVVTHISGLSFDSGLVGASPIAVLRNRMGVALASSEYQARQFRQGTLVRGVIELSTSLSVEAAKRLRDDWQGMYSGVANTGKTPVLEQGAQFKNISMTPADQQFVSQMKFSASEIAAVYNCPPAFIGADGASFTYANATHNDLLLAKYCLGPWLEYIECGLGVDNDLFGAGTGIKPRFNMDSLLRADVKSRFDMYRNARLYDVLNANEIRDLENMEPRTDPLGDQYRDEFKLMTSEGGSDDPAG